MGVFSFKKEDKKKKDSGEKKDSKDAKKVDGGGPPSTVVLKIDLHCEGCANKVKSSIRHFKGVESVNVDTEGNKLTVTGNEDPTSIKERIEKKTKKKVEIVSPTPKKDEKKAANDTKPSEKKDEKKDDKMGKSREGDKKEKEGKSVDIEKKKVEAKVVNNNFDYNAQIPYAYTMPRYNQSYYNQDYGVLTSNHGYAYDNGYVNHGYAMQYPNGPPPPPPMYLHDPRGPGMFSDENPNAACSIM